MRSGELDRPMPRRAARAARSASASSAKADLDHRAAEPRLELGGVSLGDHAAVVDHHDAVREPVGLLEVLRREQHGRAVADQLVDHLPELVAAGRVETGRRLVEEQHRWVGHERGGEVEPAAHAAGVRPQPAGRPRRVSSNRSSSSSARGAIVGSRELGQHADQPQVLAAGEVRRRRRRTGRRARCVAHGLGSRATSCRAPRPGPASGRRIVVRMRTAVVLPAPFGPSRPKTVPAGDLEVDAVEGDEVAEPLREALDLDRRITHEMTLSRCAYVVAPIRCSETYGSSPTTQLSCPAGIAKRSPASITNSEPSAMRTAARPDTTMPTCSTSHIVAPVGARCARTTSNRGRSSRGQRVMPTERDELEGAEREHPPLRRAPRSA